MKNVRFVAFLMLIFCRIEVFADDVRQLNMCIMRSICNKAEGKSTPQTMNTLGQQLLDSCAKRLKTKTQVVFTFGRYKSEQEQLSYNLFYTEKNSLKYVQNHMTCKGLQFEDKTCDPVRENISDIAALNTAPVEIQTYGDIVCQDPKFENVEYSEFLEKFKVSENKYDFTKGVNFGFGFKKNGNTCQRVCGKGQILGSPKFKMDPKSYWNNVLNGASDDGVGMAGFDQRSYERERISDQLKPECEACPSGMITDETTNRCLRNKNDQCAYDQELITTEVPTENGVETRIYCGPRCPENFQRNPDSKMCEQTKQQMKDTLKKRMNYLEQWDPEKEFTDSYFGKCSAQEIIAVAKQYKEYHLSTLKSYTSGSTYFYGTIPHTESFGFYFKRSAPDKCKTEVYNSETDQFIKKKIDPSQVSEQLWEKFSGPIPEEPGIGMGLSSYPGYGL